MAEETHGYRQKCKWIIWKERKKTAFHNSITKRGQHETWYDEDNDGQTQTILELTGTRINEISGFRRRYKWSLRSSGMLRSVAWKLITDYFPYSNSCTPFIHFKDHQFTTLILKTLKNIFKKLTSTCFGPYMRPSSGGSWAVLYAVTKLNSVVTKFNLVTA